MVDKDNEKTDKTVDTVHPAIKEVEKPKDDGATEKPKNDTMAGPVLAPKELSVPINAEEARAILDLCVAALQGPKAFDLTGIVEHFKGKLNPLIIAHNKQVAETQKTDK